MRWHGDSHSSFGILLLSWVGMHFRHVQQHDRVITSILTRNTLDMEGVGGGMRSVVAFTDVAIVLKCDDSGLQGAEQGR